MCPEARQKTALFERGRTEGVPPPLFSQETKRLTPFSLSTLFNKAFFGQAVGKLRIIYTSYTIAGIARRIEQGHNPCYPANISSQAFLAASSGARSPYFSCA